MNAKNLFLIDGLGAMLSAFLLGVVLVKFEPIFGIPTSALYVLAFFPCLFVIYDTYYFLSVGKLATPLKRIAILNLLYCCLSTGFAIYHFERIALFGWIYLTVEILIIIAIAAVEYKSAHQLISKTEN